MTAPGFREADCTLPAADGPLPGGPAVVHFDAHLVVVDKPSGMLSVPGRGPDKFDSVETRVRAAFPDCPVQPAAHRLDMDTSGLLVVARSAEAHRHLSRQFQDRAVTKRYEAVLDGVPEAVARGEREGEIALRFRLDPDDRPRQIYDPERGKPGLTRWRLLGVEKGRARIAFEPLTGRTHQLRLHAAHRLGLGVPIVGDRLYGRAASGPRLLLHAALLALRHPADERDVRWTSPPPF